MDNGDALIAGQPAIDLTFQINNVVAVKKFRFIHNKFFKKGSEGKPPALVGINQARAFTSASRLLRKKE